MSRPQYRLLSIIALIVAAIGIPAVAHADLTTDTAHIINNIRSHKKLITSFDVRYTVSVRQSSFMGQSSADVQAERVSQGRYLFEYPTGRLRNDVNNAFSWNSKTKKWVSSSFTSAVDGTRYVSLRGGSNSGHGGDGGATASPEAYVSSVKGMSGIDIGYTPRFFSSRLGNEDLDEYLDTHREAITAIKQVDPYQYQITIESPQTAETPGYRRVIIVDSRYDWNMTETQMFSLPQRLTSERKIEYAVVGRRAFPKGGTYAEYRGDDSSKPSLLVQYKAEEDTIRLNQLVKDSDFVVTLPMGTHLVDRRTGLDIRLGANEAVQWDPTVLALLDKPVESPSADSAVPSPKPYSTTTSTQPSSDKPGSQHVSGEQGPLFWWVVVACVICTGFGILFWSVRRRK